MAALSLMKGSKIMTKEETIYKISEVIITSGTLVFWDAVEPVIESGMVALFAPLTPFAPYISASLCAMGFGLSSYLLADIVPKAVSLILNGTCLYRERTRGFSATGC
jgi:CBS domain containing-hemolysin-like protein